MSEKDIAERLRDAYTRTGGNAVGDPFVSQVAREIAAVASAIEARRAETGTGSVHESAAREAGTPVPSAVWEVVEAARAALPQVEMAEFLESKEYVHAGHLEPAEWGIHVEYIQNSARTPGEDFEEDVRRFHAQNLEEADPEEGGRDLTLANRLRAALSAYDTAPRYGVEEIALAVFTAICQQLGEPADWSSLKGQDREDMFHIARAVLSLIGSGVPADERARIRNEALDEAKAAVLFTNAPKDEAFAGFPSNPTLNEAARSIEALKTKD